MIRDTSVPGSIQIAIDQYLDEFMELTQVFTLRCDYLLCRYWC